MTANTYVLEIGRRFPGTLDEFAIYDHALTAERVRVHHTIGVASGR